MKILTRFLSPCFSNSTTDNLQNNEQFTDYLNYLMGSRLENKELLKKIIDNGYLDKGNDKKSPTPTLFTQVNRKYKLNLQESQFIIFLYVKTKIEIGNNAEQIPLDMAAITKWVSANCYRNISLNSKSLQLSKIENNNLIFSGSSKTQIPYSIKLSTMNKYSRLVNKELNISTIFGQCKIATNKIKINKTNQCTPLANFFNETMTNYHLNYETNRRKFKETWAGKMDISREKPGFIDKFTHRHLWKNKKYIRARNFYFIHTNFKSLLEDIITFCKSEEFKNYINSTEMPGKKFITIPVSCFRHETSIIVSESRNSTPSEPIYKLRYYNPNNGVWLTQYLFVNKPNQFKNFIRRFEEEINGLTTVKTQKLQQVLMSAQYYLYVGDNPTAKIFKYTSNFEYLPEISQENDAVAQYLICGMATDDTALVNYGLSANHDQNSLSKYTSQPLIFTAIGYLCNENILRAVYDTIKQDINSCYRGEQLEPATPLRIAADIVYEIFEASNALDLSIVEFLLKNGANLNGCSHPEHKDDEPLNLPFNDEIKQQIKDLARNVSKNNLTDVVMHDNEI